MSWSVRRDGKDRTLTVVPVNGHEVLEGGTPVIPASTKDAGLIGVELDIPVRACVPVAGRRPIFCRHRGAHEGVGRRGLAALFPSGIGNLFHQVTNSQTAAQAGSDRAQAGVDLWSREDGDPGGPGGLGGFPERAGRDQRLHRAAQPAADAPAGRWPRARGRLRAGSEPTGRPYHADVAKLMPVAYAFVLLLAFVVLSALYLDITHPIPNPFK